PARRPARLTGIIREENALERKNLYRKGRGGYAKDAEGLGAFAAFAPPLRPLRCRVSLPAAAGRDRAAGRDGTLRYPPGRPLVVEYSKCRAVPGNTSG